MQLILIAAEAVGLVIGSLLVATLLCSLLWYVFRVVLHPELTAVAVLTLSALALTGELPRSLFLQMALSFAMVAALPLWFTGRAWRLAHRQRLAASQGHRADQSFVSFRAPRPSANARLYPAITACISEARPPTRDEVHLVASRLWREGLARRLGCHAGPASFAARRMLLRAAVAALGGSRTEGELRRKQ